MSRPAIDWAIAGWRRYLPAWFIAGEFLLAALMLQMMGHVRFIGMKLTMVDAQSGLLNSVAAAVPAVGPDLYLRELRACAAWELACVCLCVMVVVVAIAAVLLSWKSMPVDRRPGVLAAWATFWIGLLIVAAIVIHAHGTGFDGAEAVLARVRNGQTVVRTFIDAFNVIVIVGCPIVVGATAVALLHFPSLSTPKMLAHEVAVRIDRLNLLLYLGAALLVAGTLEVWSFYSWPAAYVSDAEAARFFSLAKTMSTTIGSFFSLLLASIYVPTLLQLRIARGDRIAVEDGELSQWVRPLVNVMAILAPVLAGIPLAEVLKSTMGK
jgi:hypothetical protein